MEANGAPEKLYIDFRDRKESTWRCAYTEKAMANDIEYTRTNAFIEKALRWIEENICEYCEGENIIFTASNIQYIDIFNQQQFVEDFKNYLKYGKVQD